MSIDTHAPYYAELECLLRCAEQADTISMARFGALDLHVDTKPDHTPVTDADKAVERVIRDEVAAAYSSDTVYGEELGRDESSGRRWIIDPIDGTKNFVRGVPVWATLIGLQVGDQIVASVVSAPALGFRWFALAGQGAWMGRSVEDAQRIHVSNVSALADASLSLSSLSGWKERGNRDAVIALTDDVWRLRGYGDFWQYMLVAQGAVDIAAEPELDLYDMAALVPIITEAGGRFTDLDGHAGPWGGCGLATNGLLHDEVLQRLH
ncbi:histidinol-phosphatase [Alloscardovia macacae]|uniref:Histidinol-phosphatase n=1 Tax=Alloscardovia macacae TaxID=1160091 RepID=A0A1Y2SSM6_9BIFI|nr:histidinol-phosphatase [Alloscardovia macacae]OTA25767.1 histidinol-phosphatase [Alloscardovia macacae]OTA28515.1 histidinol-phosphatase [Alloscardovia macacae]